MHQHIQTNNVGSAKRRGFGPTNSGPSARIDFFNGHAKRGHQSQGIQHRIRPDAVGDEVWRVLGKDNALAQAPVAKIKKRGDNLG